MPNVEVVGIESVAPASYGWEVLSPAPGDTSDRHAIALQCVVADDAAVLEVEAVFGTTALRASAPGPIVAPGRRSVSIEIGTAGLPSRFTLVLRAVLASGRHEPLSRVRVRRSPVTVDYEPLLAPVFVVCLPRSGSTRLMQVLAAHPGIVAGERYPLETYAAKWWLQAAKVGSDPADFRGSIRPNHIEEDPLHIGTPVHHLVHDPPAFDWMATVGVSRAATFALESIDLFYTSYARSRGKAAPRYFAEKQFIGPARPDLADDIYPMRRDLLLVRDLRDVFASRVAFHRKHHGAAAMGEDPKTALRQSRAMRRNLRATLDRMAERGDRVRVVRYEDLVRDPSAAVTDIMGFLELGHPTPEVTAAIAEGEAMTAHVTSGTVEASVDRWERDLDPKIVEVIRAELDEINAELGYS